MRRPPIETYQRWYPFVSVTVGPWRWVLWKQKGDTLFFWRESFSTDDLWEEPEPASEEIFRDTARRLRRLGKEGLTRHIRLRALFAAKIRHERCSRDLTAEEFARQVGVGSRAVVGWETCRHMPDEDSQRRLREWFRGLCYRRRRTRSNGEI